MPDLAEEKEAIREVLSEFSLYLDSGQFAEMTALFTEDGVWDTPLGEGTGRNGIAELVREMRSASPPGEIYPRIHLATDLLIKVDGDSAHVLSKWLTVRNSRAGPIVSSAGVYEDNMVKQHGTWRFRRRSMGRFIAADLNSPQLI